MPALLDPKAAPSLTGGPQARSARQARPQHRRTSSDANPRKTPGPRRPRRAAAGQAGRRWPSRPSRPASAAKLLADAKAKSDAGDLVAARAILNEPLVSGQLVDADAEAVRHALSDLNQKLVFSAKPYADDPFEEQTSPSSRGAPAEAGQPATT